MSSMKLVTVVLPETFKEGPKVLRFAEVPAVGDEIDVPYREGVAHLRVRLRRWIPNVTEAYDCTVWTQYASFDPQLNPLPK